ncbi:MAG: hypothetical protein EAZ70_05570 [Runella slithyformis]|jgi:ABC-type siderophore export system fused ATPase/permease subunit|nr:MAG: hypothetical protein EAY79_07840 [Runella slithyformis]TAF94927.1 MAG: hypothetical protein EAZ46_09035 [Runella sp.]TAG18290.1 MAG: hypothetical protein EAZ38_15240 [Cytophagales bacterium]TAG37797.1 MAG: hypothetical protein EAZ32_14255 [Cytophagia bacterium]TAF28331.1 MAG: hypothetical protein EAZ70_05570 [Runella slithyformis]
MTTQLTIDIEQQLLDTMSQTELEQSIKEWLQRLHLRAAAKEIITDLSKTDLTNDPQWQAAREIAWQQERAKYVSQ